MEDKLILLIRRGLHYGDPDIYEIHRYEIDQSKNLILSTKDLYFANDLVKGYNSVKEIKS
jgi:hypothetical protein